MTPPTEGVSHPQFDALGRCHIGRSGAMQTSPSSVLTLTVWGSHAESQKQNKHQLQHLVIRVADEGFSRRAVPPAA